MIQSCDRKNWLGINLLLVEPGAALDPLKGHAGSKATYDQADLEQFRNHHLNLLLLCYTGFSDALIPLVSSTYHHPLGTP